jgi:hypothetical protein
MAMGVSALFGMPVWGAGSDPDTRAQHNSLVTQLEALGVRLEVGAFNARPAPGLSNRRLYITTDLPFVGAMYQDSGPGGGATWIPLNIVLDDNAPLAVMGAF